MDDATLATLRNAAAAAFDVGFAGMVGALAMLALLGDATSDWAARGARRCRGLFMAAALLALAAEFAWIAAQAALLVDPPTWDAVGGLVADTAFGRAWAAATLVLAACAALAHAKRYRPMPVRVLGVGVTVVAVAHAGGGHAAAASLDWPLPTMAVHALATGLWAGAVSAAVLAVWREVPHGVDGPRCAQRLSRLATAALVGVGATGVASAWHGLGGSLTPLEPASGSSWGLLLDAKLALVAVAVLLGAFNRFVVMPSLPDAWPRFVRVLRVEAVVLLAVLVVAAWLANGEPPAM